MQEGGEKILGKGELLEEIHCQLVWEDYSFYPHIEGEG
jgi:hypothetical protein